MTTTSSNKGEIMKTINVEAADEQRLNDALTQVQLHGASDDWDAIETLDVLGAIEWDDDGWHIVKGGIRLVVTKSERHVMSHRVINYSNSVYARRVEWACSCGKTGGVDDGQQPATLRRARSAHRRHVAAATKSAS
jgi:hypothetical protein